MDIVQRDYLKRWSLFYFGSVQDSPGDHTFAEDASIAQSGSKLLQEQDSPLLYIFPFLEKVIPALDGVNSPYPFFLADAASGIFQI